VQIAELRESLLVAEQRAFRASSAEDMHLREISALKN